MNIVIVYLVTINLAGFRPQQGLTIMNRAIKAIQSFAEFRFRPQQGLTIMNKEETE